MEGFKLVLELIQQAKNNPVIITIIVFASLEAIKNIINYLNRKKEINNKDSLDYLQHITGLFDATKKQLEREREINRELYKCISKERMGRIEDKQECLYLKNLLKICSSQSEECRKLIERANSSYAEKDNGEDR